MGHVSQSSRPDKMQLTILVVTGNMMIVQGVVDGTGKFIDAVAGFPDARVLRNSNIYQEAEQGNILQVDIDGNDIGPYLVGDSAYPLTPWLIKPFPEGTNDPDEKTFNKA